MSPSHPCVFCDIALHQHEAAIIYEDQKVICFLDRTPLFHGHTLLIPKKHYQTLHSLPPDEIEFFFKRLQQISHVVRKGMSAEGTFVAMNNVVSQSVPHLHVHIVPRTRGDGLKGFFWPRHKYQSDEMKQIAKQLRDTWHAEYPD